MNEQDGDGSVEQTLSDPGGLSAVLGREREARTRAEASERRARIVAEVALALAQPVTLEAVLEAATEALSSAFVGAGTAIWLHDPARRRLRLAASRGYSAEGRRLFADVGEDNPSTMAEAFRRGDAVIYSLDDPQMPGLTRQLAERENLTFASVAAAPLLVAGRRLGALSLISRNQILDDSWFETLRAVGAQVAAAVERTTLYERERLIANRLQGALLPALEQEEIRLATGLTVAHRYRSGTEGITVGGDFYDVWSLPATPEGPPVTRLAVVLGDVSGKGLEAAVQTAALRHAVQAYAHEDPTPATVVSRVSDLIIALDLLPYGFATMFFATVDAGTGAVDYCSAGHESLLLRHGDGRIDYLDATAPALGLVAGRAGQGGRTAMEAGGQLVLFTDGVTEARHPQTRRLLGTEGFAALLNEIYGSGQEAPTATGLASRLLGRVEEYAGGRLEDDAALLIIARPQDDTLTAAVAASSSVG